MGADIQFGDERAPAYDPRREVPGSVAGIWGDEGGGGTAQPWEFLDEFSVPGVEVQPLVPSDDPGTGKHEGTQEGGLAEAAGRDARVLPDVRAPVPFGLDPVSDSTEAPFSQSDGHGDWPTGASRNGNPEVGVDDLRGASAPVLDDKNTGMGTGQGGATDAEGSIARAHNQGKKPDDSEEEGTQATMTHQPETATAEASGERETTPSHAASNSLATEEETTGTSEGFSPPTTNSRHEDVVSSLWEKDAIGPDVFGGRQQGNDNAVPAGERCLDADASQASHAPPSRVVGAGTATGAWSAGETDAMPGQQEEDGKGMRQDAEWWDWEDPWGQEAAWGAPGG